MINPIFMKTFLVLCKTRHFTKTADVLNMTQPGVSQHLKRLEDELNVSLFYREGKGMELTPAGEEFRQFALAQRDAEKRLRDSLGEDSPYNGECRITCSGSMATRLYPILLGLQQKHHGLRMNLEAAPNSRSVDLVKQNEYDIGLITRYIDDPEIEITELGYEELSLILPHKGSGKWSDLMELGYINHPNGAHYATQVLEKNYPNEFSGFKAVVQKGYINQLDQILLPVAQGLGFTVLPESTVDRFPEPNLIKKVPLRKACRETIYQITKKYKPLANRYTLIHESLKELW